MLFVDLLVDNVLKEKTREHAAYVIGSIFALYCTYSVQLSDPKFKIAVNPSTAIKWANNDNDIVLCSDLDGLVTCSKQIGGLRLERGVLPSGFCSSGSDNAQAFR